MSLVVKPGEKLEVGRWWVALPALVGNNIYGVGMLVSLTNIPTPYYLPEVVMVGGRAVT